LPPGIAQLLLPATDAAAGIAIAALDADVLVDVDGMAAATSTLLAQHPARHVWTVASLPHSEPLIDRSFENAEALAAALRSLHDARDARPMPADAAAMAAVWTEAPRATSRATRGGDPGTNGC
jgi:hypothetical protein